MRKLKSKKKPIGFTKYPLMPEDRYWDLINQSLKNSSNQESQHRTLSNN
jgi:hypothetical protein